MLRHEPTGGTLYHAYAKSVENLDANLRNKMAANYLQNCNIPKLLKRNLGESMNQGTCVQGASTRSRSTWHCKINWIALERT